MDDQLAISVTLSSIQDLPEALSVGESDAFAVAQPQGGDWQTRKVSYGQIRSDLAQKYNLSGLSGVYGKISSIVNTQMVLSVDTANPYVISSLTFSDGRPVSADGYRLSSILSVEDVSSYAQDEKIHVATMWFAQTSAAISIPKQRENFVTFVRWPNLEN